MAVILLPTVNSKETTLRKESFEHLKLNRKFFLFNDLCEFEKYIAELRCFLNTF